MFKFTEQLKTPWINIKNMAISKGDQLLAADFHALMDKIAADILQIAKKWNWKLTFTHQEYFFFRKIPAINASFAPKYLHLQGWFLKFGQNCKDVPTEILKLDARTNSN